MSKTSKLNKTEQEILGATGAGGSYFVSKQTTMHSQRKANAANKLELAGLIRRVNDAGHYGNVEYVAAGEGK